MNRTSRNRTAIVRAAVLVLPLLGLTAAWALAGYNSQRGTEWLVPIEGYDPRDLLRGHYVLYRYRWPGLSEGTDPNSATKLCVAGSAPWIERTYIPVGRPCPNPLQASRFMQRSLYGLGAGVFYASLPEARRLEKQLQVPELKAMIRIRVREDGTITPLHISFHPRAAHVYGPDIVREGNRP